MNVKSEVLSLLESSKGAFLSGSTTAKALNVSRNAVWKAVERLKSDGHLIVSAPHKGYKLEKQSDLLSKEGIWVHLKDKSPANELFVFEELDSTNRKAKELVAENDVVEPIVVANYQTAGRGRLGRSFFSPAGKGIYLSIVLKPNLHAENALLMTTACAVSVAQVLEETFDVSPKIKWINDIFLGDKKICGILTQASTNFETGLVDYVVLGIGLNVHTKEDEFPPELRSTAGSLAGKVSANFSRNELTAKLIEKVYSLCRNPKSKEFIEYYKSHSMVLHEDIEVIRKGTTLDAYVLDILENGALKVRFTSGEEEILQSGEVSIRKKGVKIE